MNKIFTLFVMGMLCLSVNRSFAQVNENFDNTSIDKYLSNCWSLTGIKIDAKGPTPNVASTKGANSSEIATPYIDITGLVNISFSYQLTKTNGNPIIEIGTLDKYKKFVSYSLINVNSTSTELVSLELSIPKDVLRIAIRYTNNGTGTADGNTYVNFDNLKITGNSYHYAPTTCNTPPQTIEDTYTVAGHGTHVVTRSVLGNDSDPVNTTESLKAVFVYMDPAQGTINLNEDGTFVYKPNSTFMGDFATFTYRAVDNGYDPASSAETTVHINIVEGTILPVKLINFSGNLMNQKAQLTWQVADNETGSHFEVQKSNDGKSFTAQTVVFCSAKTGTEAYQFTDAAFTSDKAYYRLKTVNKDGSVSYSKMLYLSSEKTEANNTISLLQNPVRHTLSFAFTAAAAEENEIAIYNMAGVKLHTQKIKAAKGTNQMTLDIDSKLGTGTYVLTVQSTTASRVTKFVKY